ncbi:MAG: DedA family protein [Candidatus Kapabacteria bacterium]|nr:DedA family protein [Candidatus Kapabacteria bacterium]
MAETIVQYIQSVPWYWVLVFSFIVTFTENIFPPAPCDSILVFMGTLVGIGVVGYIPILITSTLGSWLGFVLMFWLGKEFGLKIIDSGKFKFITRESLKKPEQWFQKYGMYVIAVNRFMSGTRAVISFFAGLMELSTWKTSALSALSALLWNIILLSLGLFLGSNWKLADKYMKLYGEIILPIILIITLYFVIRWILQRKKQAANS